MELSCNIAAVVFPGYGLGILTFRVGGRRFADVREIEIELQCGRRLDVYNGFDF